MERIKIKYLRSAGAVTMEKVVMDGVNLKWQ